MIFALGGGVSRIHRRYVEKEQGEHGGAKRASIAKVLEFLKPARRARDYWPKTLQDYAVAALRNHQPI